MATEWEISPNIPRGCPSIFLTASPRPASWWNRMLLGCRSCACRSTPTSPKSSAWCRLGMNRWNGGAVNRSTPRLANPSQRSPFPTLLISPGRSRHEFSIRPAPRASSLLRIFLKKLEEAREAVEGASDDLEENPLVQEVRLIELIKTIMETPSEIQEFFEGWLKNELIPDFSDLEDDEIDAVVNRFNAEAEKIKNALCYAKKLLQFLARFSDANKARFEAVVARIDALKNLMDHSQNFEAIYSDLRRAIEDLQGLLKDKSEDFLKEKLKDTIEKKSHPKAWQGARGRSSRSRHRCLRSSRCPHRPRKTGGGQEALLSPPFPHARACL